MRVTDDIEPLLWAATTEARIASCRARRIPIAQVLAVTHQLLAADPAALLCPDSDCRCLAALRQWQRLDRLTC